MGTGHDPPRRPGPITQGMTVRRPSLLAVLLLLLLAATPAAAPAQIAPAEYAARRDRLMATLGDGIFVLQGADEPAEDYLAFWQSPDFEYLTGLREPGAAMILSKSGGAVTQFLFTEEKNPAREVWTGARLGPEKAGANTGMTGRRIGDFQKVLDSLVAAAPPKVFVVGNDKAGVALKARAPQLTYASASGALQRLRGAKSEPELACLRKSIQVTNEAQKLAMRAVRPEVNEFEIQGLIEYTFRRNGADRPSFGTIVGSGPNSTTLHYNANDRTMRAGEVVVMDIGASYRGYAADVTRTVPVSGKFSPEQRAIYQVVRDAQAAAEKEAVIGAPANRMSAAASATLAAGLAKLGLIESPGATYDCGAGGTRQCPQLGLYYMHGLGHGIGLEVHDPEQYYYSGTIAAGSAFTIEPGIYVRENLMEILPKTPRNEQFVTAVRATHERYKNIGVRIEDSYVVSAAGVEWVSRVPREMDEVEAAMKLGPAMLSTAAPPVDASCGPLRVQP